MLPCGREAGRKQQFRLSSFPFAPFASLSPAASMGDELVFNLRDLSNEALLALVRTAEGILTERQTPKAGAAKAAEGKAGPAKAAEGKAVPGKAPAAKKGMKAPPPPARPSSNRPAKPMPT